MTNQYAIREHKCGAAVCKQQVDWSERGHSRPVLSTPGQIMSSGNRHYSSYSEDLNPTSTSPKGELLSIDNETNKAIV
ncbi:hypothetical protein RRG08_053249 [Elysia crispata]|uniref:Uncharacterized protein n=1 Tax=Elysia crispata TaxID=231223 RepID=A0AAE1APK1_9GAST|nr:hypothetical protein RRG08_053249 [Elysia crispata]